MTVKWVKSAKSGINTGSTNESYYHAKFEYGQVKPKKDFCVRLTLKKKHTHTKTPK